MGRRTRSGDSRAIKSKAVEAAVSAANLEELQAARLPPQRPSCNSVNGRSGTMLFTYEGIGNLNTGHENLRFVGTQGTGDLAGVVANLTAEGDLGGACDGDFGGHGTYSGHVLFTR